MRPRYASVIARDVWRPERIASCNSAIVVSSKSNGLTGADAAPIDLFSSVLSSRCEPSTGESARAVPAKPLRKNVRRSILALAPRIAHLGPQSNSNCAGTKSPYLVSLGIWGMKLGLRRSLLYLLLGLAAVLYFVHVPAQPAGFSIDESSICYNAYTISQTGHDEYGQPWPLFFRAFGEYK